MDSSKKDKSTQDASIKRLVRRELNFLTKRMSYNVRANEDKNLFIVDDTYDKDFDIIAYEKSLTDGIKTYNDDFTTVREKISHVSQLLNMEVFCDTQGHIRVRSPQYNRMPSSVFYKMMHLRETLGIQIFPQFLNDLFKSKLETLKTRLEILEDQIRLDCALLNYNTDEEAVGFAINSGASYGIGTSFSFISDPGYEENEYKNGGTITQIDNLISAANPDKTAKNSQEGLTAFKKIEVESLSNKDILTNSQKYELITYQLKKQKEKSNGTSIVEPPYFLSDTDSGKRVDVLVKRIFTKSGIRVDKKDYLNTNADQSVGIELPPGTQVDIFKVVGELADKLREHQKVSKMFYNTIKNAREFQYLDDKKNSGNLLITPGIHGQESIPEVFEHMIEDETYDDYGPGSGSRYIIKSAQIKSLNISENPPATCMVEVQGIFDPLIPNISNEGFNALSPNGNGLTSATAVDYDMWRNYGFKQGPVVNVPFLKDPVTQCGPYAAMLLSRNRKNILRGTLTITGNEYMQPGEVIYIEDRGLLFYVASVKHNFTFGSVFTTTLDLTYGHTPGEYIPTPMDMMGKMIYNNKDVAELTVERQDTSSNDINIGVLQLSKNNSDADGGIGKSLAVGDKAKNSNNSFASANAKTINDIIYTTAYQLTSNNAAGKDVIAKIELRTYYDKSNAVNDKILEFAGSIRDILTGNGLSAIIVSKKGSEPKPIDKNYIKLATETTVNLDDVNDRRSPSQKAIDSARNISISNKSSTLSINDESSAEKKSSELKSQQDSIRKALFENVVDCWLSISSKETEGC